MQEEAAIHLLDYLRVIRKRRWIIIASVVVVAVTVMIGNLFMTPIYQATAKVIIDQEKRRSPLTGQIKEYESYLSETLTFQTHFKLITSRPVREKVIERLETLYQDRTKTKKIPEGAFFAFKKTIRKNLNQIKSLFSNILKVKKKNEKVSHRDPTLWLKSIVSVEQIQDTRLLNIRVYYPDPVFAQQIANSVADVYIEYNMYNKLKAAQKTLSWLNKELGEMKKKISESERDFYEFKEKKKIFSITGKQEIDAQKIAEFNASLFSAANKRMEIEAKIKELKKITQQASKSYSNPTIINSPLLENLHQQLTQSEIELSRLLKIYKQKHPKVIKLNTEIGLIKAKFREELKKSLGNLRAEQSVLKARERALASSIKQYESDALETGKKEIQYAIRERDLETNKELYNLLLSKLKEANIAGGMETSNIRLIEPAFVPSHPIRPRKKMNIILGIVVGLMIGTGLSFFLEYLDRTVRTPDDVECYLQLPLLAVIPKIDSSSTSSASKS